MNKAPRTAAYGTWASPVSAESLASSGVGLADLRARGDRLYWLETRPEEGGRLVAVEWSEGGRRVLTPADSNVRTRVHEYGGAAHLPTADGLWYVNFRDQGLYRAGGDGKSLTPAGYRYADLVEGGGRLIGVREDHSDPADVRNALVRLNPDEPGPGELLWGESDFVAYPRLSHDGRRLAWISWNHPDMPWDATRLHVADLGPEGLSNMQVVAGGPGVSVIEPQWTPDGGLVHISDESGFWNLHLWSGGTSRSLAPLHAEFAGPLWGLGQSNYVLLPGGGIAAVHGSPDGDRLVLIGPDGKIRHLPLPFTALRSPQGMDGGRVALIGASPAGSSTVIIVDTADGGWREVHQPSPVWLDPRYISVPEALTFPTTGGLPCHALYYPPRNDDFAAPEGEAPPLIVQAHGGPTGQAQSAFSLAIQFWTSRGFGVVDVDYGGSSGYGRAYRQRLQGAWGIVDVDDVIAAARHLIDSRRADPARIAIHGGSAGGFTVLAALSQSDVFKAGGDFYGVADLEALARDTHKFESRYLDGLIGPWPEAQDIYLARSPIHHLEGFTAPLLILQGAEDPIVPPNQAHMIRDALRAKKVPVAYIEFAGEGHGFRRSENVIAAKQAELAFYGRIFGFEPADDLPPIEIENLPVAGTA